MKTICLFILIHAISVSLFSQTSVLHRVTDPKVEQWELGDSVGYANDKGNMVIPFGKYRCCYNEKFDKMAIVSYWNRPGIYAIDRNEKILFEVVICDNGPDMVQEGVFRIKKNDKIGFADMQGNIIIAPQFDAAQPFSEGFAGVCIGGKPAKDGEYTTHIGGKWKFIDKRGKPINAEEYCDLRSFRNGVASVEKMENGERLTEKGRLLFQ